MKFHRAALAIFCFAAVLTLALPVAWAELRLDFRNYRVDYVASNRTIEIIGPFGPGIAEKLRQVLTKHPDVEWVNLSSPGGAVTEGRRVRDLINSRHLNTYVRTVCVSACTLAFIGGAERVIHRDAVIGFHQYKFMFANFLFESLRDHTQEMDRRFFAGRGVSREFLARMFDAPNSELLELSAEEAVKERVATQVTDRFTAPPIEYLLPEMRRNIEAATTKFERLHAAFGEYSPDAKYRFTMAIHDFVLSNEPQMDIGNLVAAYSVGLSDRLVPTTSDAAAQGLAGAMVDLLSELGKRSTRQCTEAVLGDGGIAVDWVHLSEATLVTLVDAYVQIVRDANERPQPRMTVGERDRAIDALGRSLVDEMNYPDLVFLGDIKNYAADPDRTCRVMIEYFSVMADMEDHRGGAALRASVEEELTGSDP